MGFYIEVDQPKGKADRMVDLHGAEKIDKPDLLGDVPEGKTLLCVVENALFDAICICHDSYKFDQCANPDDLRPKIWMLIDTDKAETLNPAFAKSNNNRSVR